MAATDGCDTQMKKTLSPAVTARSNTSISETNTALEDTEHLSLQDSFTAHQPDITQISLSSVVNTELSNATEEPSLTTFTNPSASDIVVMLNGRILPRPPLPRDRQILRGRSATPIRVPYDPIRPRRTRSESPQRQFRGSDWEQMAASLAAGTHHNANNFDESTADDFFIQRARLRSTRRPMYDGDSTRNMAGRRIFLGNDENGGAGLQFITARIRLNRNRRPPTVLGAQRPLPQRNVGGVATTNNDNGGNEVELPDPVRAIPLPPPLPPYMLRPLGTPSINDTPPPFFRWPTAARPQFGVRNGTADRGRPRQQRRVTWDQEDVANGETPQATANGEDRLPNENDNGNTNNNNRNANENTSNSDNNNNNAASNCILS